MPQIFAQFLTIFSPVFMEEVRFLNSLKQRIFNILITFCNTSKIAMKIFKALQSGIKTFLDLSLLLYCV